jgi:hypothetical protein
LFDLSPLCINIEPNGLQFFIKAGLKSSGGSSAG